MIDQSLIRDVLGIPSSVGTDFGLISLDEEKTFDRVEHLYLWKGAGRPVSRVATFIYNLHKSI